MITMYFEHVVPTILIHLHVVNEKENLSYESLLIELVQCTFTFTRHVHKAHLLL